MFSPSSAFSTTAHPTSTPSSYIQLDIEPSSSYAILRLNRPPVNSMNIDLIREFSNTLAKMEEKSNPLQGFILASNQRHIFSAGLDILEMYQAEEGQLRKFWTALQDLFLRLYVTPLVSIAAVEGHAPAGGCFLAMNCDYRIMTKENAPKMGLNETRLGIVAPLWFQQVLINTIGYRQSELMLNLGLQYDAEKALELNLIDAAVDTVAEVMPLAESTMTQWLKIPEHARSQTKLQMRKHVVEALRQNREADTQLFVDTVTDPKAQKAMGLYLQALKQKK